MVVVGEFHVRVLYLVGAVGVLFLLRKPLRHPDRPGSRWLVLTIGAVSTWLCGVGLYYFVHGLTGSLILYNVVLFSVTVCFVGWSLIAVEFATGRRPSRPILLALGAYAAVHFVVLWTNFFWLHELVYESTTFVDDGGGINVDRGPLFWVHIVVTYVLVFLSTVLFAAEWANSSGLRRRQAGTLAVTPVFGVGASVLWFLEVLPLPFDPTPIGVTVGVALLSWALYRAEFLEIAPVGRRTVVEELTDAVIILDDENGVVDWNAAARDLFGVEEPAAGMPAEEFFEPVPADTLADFEAAVSDFEGAAQPHAQVSFELDGRERHFSVSISPIENEHAGLLGRAVVVRDVTGLKRRERQLVKQNEHLEEFASVVSHDLQGPLMEVRASADLAIGTRDVSHVDRVLDAADRMEQLVEGLLQLARTGREIETVEPVDLDAAAERAWRRVWSPDADLVAETDRTVVADPDRLQQLLENLLRNGVEHGSAEDREASDDAVDREPTGTRDDGSRPVLARSAPDDPSPASGESGRGAADGVRVTVGPLPDGFYVEDDGPGIPPADRERVFDRGYSTSDDGTGLGLGIVRQIAGAHGWSVRATEGTAGGARFEITGVEFEMPDDDG